ncbi:MULTISPECIES: RagB/SusD family nutrient uptake outer membrane protein [Niastella]|uniref:RagB/SusD family nutrient uptake outer membrane protein n=1 Tax=Niastella soli TaxID=2821487 RepID=A0ABS3YYI4_9BACT|nr:RagB/SusD family nutrient uptake outer membrane protein [Niastella soli]MBO9202981.1 RagB/SusD family nutrient uptake outer membrane protein [Niastella soli]
MKHLIIYTSLLLILGSCKKYLNENPDNRADINTVDKVAKLLVTAYPDRTYLFNETASDNAEDRTTIASKEGQPFTDLYFWHDPEGTSDCTPAEYWIACYKAIASANHALDAIEKNNFGDKVLPYKGEALIARAYVHHMLAIHFATPYAPGGANDGMGIPYVDKPETVVFQPYDRGTVQSVYERIEQDLTEGMKLLRSGSWEVPKYHFNPQAAHAFAARFYLFKGDWDKVIEHVSAIFPENNFYDNLHQYAGDLWSLSSEQIQAENTKAERSFNLLLANTYSIYQRAGGAGANRYGFGEKVKNESGGTTVFGLSFRTNIRHYGEPNYTPGKYEEYFYITNVAQGTGLSYIMMPLFTVDEALMNRAEAYIQKENYPLAIADLNELGRARARNYTPATNGLTVAKAKTFTGKTDDKQAMLAALLDTKKRAFIQEGIRWMDILRNNLTVKHNHIDQRGTETFAELPPGDPRRVFQLPKDVNTSDVPLNPR